MPYVPFTAVDEVLSGAAKYNINGTPNQTINLDTPVVQAGTPVNAALLNNINTGIVESGGAIDIFKTSTSSTGNIGALTLNGTTAYATVPASVGQLTNGTTPFELVNKIKIGTIGTQNTIFSKYDTNYTGTSPKGWSLTQADKIYLQYTPTNGTAITTLTGTTLFNIGQVAHIKFNFDGTTINVYSSNDGLNWITEITSTDSNLKTALSISDNVITQIGRRWYNNAFVSYFTGIIYKITLSKSGTMSNIYSFNNAGTNTTIIDDLTPSTGVSAGGAVQSVSGTNYAVTTGKITSLTNGRRCDFIANATTEYNLILDGTDDYATIPNTVGQLTNGTNTFELLLKLKFNDISGQDDIISKRDTGYSTTTNVKGWSIRKTSSNFIALLGSNANGTSDQIILGTTPITANTLYFIKVLFDGTTVTLQISFDGITWITEGTSTNATLIGGLSTSDNVLTQIGRQWYGSSSYPYYINANIYYIQLKKLGTLINLYEFKNIGTNTSIIDSVSAANGISAGGAIQSLSQIITAIDPTLAVDGLLPKPIIGSPIVQGGYYDCVYISALDSFYAFTQESKQVGKTFLLSSQATSFTIGGLDIVRDGGIYDIVISGMLLNTNTTGTVNMTLNGITTATNYFNGTTLNSNNTTNTAIIFASGVVNLDPVNCVITMQHDGSHVSAINQGEAIGSGGVKSIYHNWATNVNITYSNVNSITFTQSSNNFDTDFNMTVKVFKK